MTSAMAAARAIDADTSSIDGHATIDVVSHVAAAAAAPRHSRQTESASTLTDEDDEGEDNYLDDVDDDLDDGDVIVQDIVYDDEFAYHRGRHAVPMHSPGDELTDIDLTPPAPSMRRSSATNRPRLPRLRNRVFFQHNDSSGNDDVATGDSSSDSAGSHPRLRRRRVLFRRRKRQEGDVFWTAIVVSNVLSLAVLACLVVYLTQTDFFASHQKELFGTTVDNRFTVVSQEDARAKIYLKSGYSNSRYSEAMIAFGDGVLQLGRRALASTDAQRFYGLALAHNGTAGFTNKVTAPFVATEYLHLSKSIVFADGTVMTTAANLSSGGVKETGDLNLVSTNGSVITSAGGQPVLIVEPQGRVVVPKLDADDPNALGVVIDGATGRISIGDAFAFTHTTNASTISTAAQALRLNATRIVFGTVVADKVTLTVPRPSQDPTIVTADDNKDDMDDSGDVTEDNDDDTLDRRTLAGSLVPPTPLTLELVGQSSASQATGGDIWLAGGDGLDHGGNVVIMGGVALALDSLHVGAVAINAQLDVAGASLTEIGTPSATHVVHLHGNVQLNANVPANGTGSNDTQVAVGGGAFVVASQRIAIDNVAAANATSLVLDSHAITIGHTAHVIAIGSSTTDTTLTIDANTITIDSNESIAIGAQAQRVRVGKSREGWEDGSKQSLELVSDSIRLSSAFSSAADSDARSSLPTATGAGATNASSTRALDSVVRLPLVDVEIVNRSVWIDARRFAVGRTNETASIALQATSVTLGGGGGTNQNATVRVESQSFVVASDSIEIGTDAASTTTLRSETVVIDASDAIYIGTDDADDIVIGNKDAVDVRVVGKTIALDGATHVAGDNLVVNTTAITLGGTSTTTLTLGDAATMSTVVAGTSIDVGAHATSIAIGSAASVINLRGKMLLNGAPLTSRRGRDLLRAHDNDAANDERDSDWFAALTAARFAIDVLPATRRAFALPVTEHVVAANAPAAVVRVQDAEIADDSSSRTTTTALVVHEHVASGHAHVSLTLDAVRLQIEASSSDTVGTSKLRCRVYRLRTGDADTSSAVAVLEATSAVEHCVASACDDDIFAGVSSDRIVAFDSGDRFDVQCLVVATVQGKLLVESAQLGFVTL